MLLRIDTCAGRPPARVTKEREMSRRVYIAKTVSDRFDHNNFSAGDTPEKICAEQPHFTLFEDIVHDAFSKKVINSKVVDHECCFIRMNKADMIKYLDKERYRKRPECFSYMPKIQYERHVSEEIDHLISAAKDLPDDEEHLLVACVMISPGELDAEEYHAPRSEGSEKAMHMAAKAHRGQKDRQGEDYMHHLIMVSVHCVTERGKTAALLHDIVEDTDVTLNDLLAAGISKEIVKAVDCTTKRKGEGIGDYYKRIASDDIATEVKFADMYHNSDRDRFPKGEEEKAEKNYEKYVGRARYLFDLVGEERAKRLMSEHVYRYFLAGFRR